MSKMPNEQPPEKFTGIRLTEVPKTILETMEIIPVETVDEVLKIALTKPLKRVEWVEVDQIAKKDKAKKEELSTH